VTSAGPTLLLAKAALVEGKFGTPRVTLELPAPREATSRRSWNGPKKTRPTFCKSGETSVLAMGDISIGPPMPQISALVPRNDLKLEVTWEAGLRKGKTDIVDLTPLIKSFKFYRRLLEARAFAAAKLEDDGQTVVWDGGIDMPAISIERLAEESMDVAEFRAFLKALDLTQVQAAALLGYGRRQIAHYASGTKPIPRIVALACRALVDRRADNKEYMLSWSSERDVTSALITRASMPVVVQHVRPHTVHNLKLYDMQITRSAARYGT
jgi:hypothetical protein